MDVARFLGDESSRLDDIHRKLFKFAKYLLLKSVVLLFSAMFAHTFML